MEKRVQDSISSYFIYLKQYKAENYVNLKYCLEILKKLNIKIKKYALLSNILSKNSVIIKNDLLTKKAMYVILDVIDEELNKLKERISFMESAYFKLNNKFISFGNSLHDFTWEENSPLIVGTSDQPSLSKLYEYAQDSWTFYHEQITQVNASLLTLEITEESLSEAFKIFSQNVSNTTQMDEIIMFTQFIT